MDSKLELTTAQASWNRGENDNKWCVKKPDGEILFILDGNFDEKSAMEAIHFGRIFESRALNIGIAYGKELQEKADLDELVKLRSAVANLGKMNEQLSEQLDRHMNK
jgi:hypothetical protein